MNEQVLKKITAFVSHLSSNENEVVNPIDRILLYNVAIAVWNNQESISDAKTAVETEIIVSGKFTGNAETRIVEDCKKKFDIVYDFVSRMQHPALEKINLQH